MSQATRPSRFFSKQDLPVAAISAGFAILPLVNADPYVLGVWTFILLNLFVIIGLDLLLGYCGQLSLGHGVFVSIGAYASALLTTKLGLSGWLAIPVGLVVAGVAAAIVAIPTLRLRSYYLAMATLGFPIVFDGIIKLTSGFSGGSSGVISVPRLWIGNFPLREPTHYYYLVLIIFVPLLYGVWRVANSRWGLELRAIHADETAAMARGVNVVRLKILAFIGSAMLAALSGSLYVHNVQFVSPDTFGLLYSITAVVMLVVGGMGRIWGGIIGAITLMWIPEVLRETATWQPVIFGTLLAIIMLFAPSGLAGIVRRRPSFVPDVSGLDPALVRSERVDARGPVLLSVSALERSFGGVRAVSGVSFELRKGSIKSIIGPNGAGKSTALALISGALGIDSGRIQFKGIDVARRPAFMRARMGIGRTFQHSRLIPNLTVFENIVLGCSAASPERRVKLQTPARLNQLLERLGLTEVASSYPGEVNQFQRRLTELGAALASDPDLILLDEPAAGLSTAEVDRLAELLRQEKAAGGSILLVDHIMQLVLSISDEILVLHHGTPITEGAPAAILEDESVRAAYLGRRKATHA